jgi:hypothetical protein
MPLYSPCKIIPCNKENSMKLANSMPAIALALGSTMLTYTVQADEVKPTAAMSNTKAPSQATPTENMRQFSSIGHAAILDIGDARLAIFSGEPKTAVKLMESAKTSLSRAAKDAPMFTPSGTQGSSLKGDQLKSVPVDGQIVLADDFIMTPEKKSHVEKANEQFKKGEHAKGIEELRLGEIDVNYTRWWLPLASAERHLTQAIKLADEGKYYESNLALKAIEDSITTDSITFNDVAANKVK